MKKPILSAAVFCVLFLISGTASASSLPPSASADIPYPQTSRTVQVPAGGDLQKYIDNASSGDELVLPAGVSFPGPIVLRNKSGNSLPAQAGGWIIIRSSGLDRMPAGTRISPGNERDMAKILAPGRNLPALKTEPGAHNYYLAGIEFAKSSPDAVAGTLVLLGSNDSGQTSLSAVPHDLVLDRVYVHGDDSSNLKRGVELNSARTAVKDSYISNIHAAGQDSQAIGGLNGPGPFFIQNNYLEAAGENILFGGDDPKIPDLVPADIEIRGNLLSKPLAWRLPDQVVRAGNGSPHWTVKNLLELKNAERVVIAGNVLENSWADGQVGPALVLTPRNQGGNCAWCVVRDVAFERNIVRRAGEGVQIMGHDYVHPSRLTERILIRNNLFEDISSSWGGPGTMFLITSGTSEPGPNEVEISHNTGFGSGTVVDANKYSSGKYIPKSGFVFRDNIFAHNRYGIKGDNAGIGDDALAKYFPDAVFARNVLVGGSAKLYAGHADNFFPATWAEVGLNDDKTLSGASSFKGRSSDGKDIGYIASGAASSPAPLPPVLSPVVPPVVPPAAVPAPPPALDPAPVPAQSAPPAAGHAVPAEPPSPAAGGSGGSYSPPPPPIQAPPVPDSISNRIAILQTQLQALRSDAASPAGAENFSRNLRYGLRSDPEVRRLQTVLLKGGYYAGPVTGNFYGLTLGAVKRFQRTNYLPATGFVGPLTRGMLNG